MPHATKTTDTEVKELVVGESDQLRRLDIYLALKLPHFSRSQIKQMINNDQVLVNSEIEFHPQYKVKLDDVITITLPERQVEHEIRPSRISLDIIFESESVLIINKPSGLVVHPGSSHWKDTLANGVKYYLQKKGEDLFDAERAGLVHRLDKPTSGVIIIAKNPEALWQLSRQFAQRQVEKHYLAVVKGVPRRKMFTVAVAIGRDRSNRQKFSSRGNHLRPATTDFKVLHTSKDSKYALVLAKPLTGRTHQIRVHLAEAGHAIVGDLKYGGDKSLRMLLHAYKLGIGIPVFNKSGEQNLKLKEFKAELPQDFIYSAKQLGLDLDGFKLKV